VASFDWYRNIKNDTKRKENDQNGDGKSVQRPYQIATWLLKNADIVRVVTPRIQNIELFLHQVCDHNCPMSVLDNGEEELQKLT
jgi:hypothetical protein